MRTRANLIGNATRLHEMVEDGDFGPPFEADGSLTFAGGIRHMCMRAASDPDWQRWPLEKRGEIKARERELEE